MTKFLTGFFLGVCVTIIAGVVIGRFSPRLSPDAYFRGRFHEDLDIGHRIPDALGRDIDPNEPMEPFLGGKEHGVVIVTRRGVKTLRLCCDDFDPKPTP
jgi:hypothetical protein